MVEEKETDPQSNDHVTKLGKEVIGIERSEVVVESEPTRSKSCFESFSARRIRNIGAGEMQRTVTV